MYINRPIVFLKTKASEAKCTIQNKLLKTKVLLDFYSGVYIIKGPLKTLIFVKAKSTFSTRILEAKFQNGKLLQKLCLPIKLVFGFLDRIII